MYIVIEQTLWVGFVKFEFHDKSLHHTKYDSEWRQRVTVSAYISKDFFFLIVLITNYRESIILHFQTF